MPYKWNGFRFFFVNSFMDIDKYLSLGVEKKLISIDYDNDKIIYEELNKSYKFSDPEEKVRASIYIILIEKYKYSPDVIELEVAVPRRTPNDSADIVVFTDTTKKQSHIVVEAKKEGVSQSEFLQAIEQGFGNANSLRSAYLLVSDFQKNSFIHMIDQTTNHQLHFRNNSMISLVGN